MSGKQLTLLEQPATRLLDELGAGKASPGSGCAATLMALIACKMIVTVCSKSSEKQELANNFAIFEFIKEKVKIEIEPRFKVLFDLDAQGFEKVVELRITRDGESDPIHRARLARKANAQLETVSNLTIELIERSFDILGYSITIFDTGWPHVRGDSGVAISASIAAITSGIFILGLNLKTLKSRKFAQDNAAMCETYYARLRELQENAMTRIVALSKEAVEAIQLEMKGL